MGEIIRNLNWLMLDSLAAPLRRAPFSMTDSTSLARPSIVMLPVLIEKGAWQRVDEALDIFPVYFSHVRKPASLADEVEKASVGMRVCVCVWEWREAGDVWRRG